MCQNRHISSLCTKPLLSQVEALSLPKTFVSLSISFSYDKVVFSSLHSQPNSSFPQKIDVNIVANDLFRIVNAIVDNLNLDGFKKLYKGSGVALTIPK